MKFAPHPIAARPLSITDFGPGRAAFFEALEQRILFAAVPRFDMLPPDSNAVDYLLDLSKGNSSGVDPIYAQSMQHGPILSPVPMVTGGAMRRAATTPTTRTGTRPAPAKSTAAARPSQQASTGKIAAATSVANATTPSAPLSEQASGSRPLQRSPADFRYVLQPGTGFEGATTQPAPVGDPTSASYNTIVTAHWDIVPQQSSNTELPIGVSASQPSGIDHVEFSVNYGPWTHVTQMTVNGLTNATEYVANLRPSDFAVGTLEVRAVAYPISGIPRVLNGLDLYRSSAGLALAGKPVVEWATRDAFPVSGSTARVAVAAVDGWSGIDSVTFHFSQAVTSNGVTAVSHTVTNPQWLDLFGHGIPADYWTLDFETAGLSQVQVTVSVKTRDGQVHTGSAASSVAGATDTTWPSCVVRILQAPQAIYLDGSAGNDFADGSSWNSAKRTLAAALQAAGSSADIIRIRPATYVVPDPIDAGARQKYLRLIADSAGVVFQGNAVGTQALTIHSWLSFEGITWQLGEGLRAYKADHVNFEDSQFNFSVNTYSGSHFDGPQSMFDASTHLSFIEDNQSKGFRGPVIEPAGGVPSTDVIVSGLMVRDSGTTMQNDIQRALIERVSATGNAISADYDPTIHFDFLHSGTGDASSHAMSQIVRYCSSIGNGSLNSQVPYNFWLVSEGGADLVAYNNIADNVQLSYSVMQLEGDWSNVQILNNSLLATDNGLSGFAVSNKSATMPSISRDLLVAGNIVNAVDENQTLGGIDAASNTSLVWNIYTSQPYFYVPRSTEQTLSGPTALDLLDISQGELSPSTQSPFLHSEGSSDVRFDFGGIARSAKPTPGAFEQ